MTRHIILLAPVPPFRGGIARHSQALARELAGRKGVRVSVESFARLYPRLLYPGQGDRDDSLSAPVEYPVRFQLDSINPLRWRACARRVIAARPDLVVMPAWTFFVAPVLGWIARRLRKAGIPVVMMVHNAYDHDGGSGKKALSRWQLAGADLFLTHNAQLANDIADLTAARRIAIHPHPLFDDYPAPTGRLPREHALELLFFGLVRPYKGLDIAIEAVARSELADVRLTVAGEFWQGRAETDALIARLGLTNSVEIIDRYVSDAEAAEYFGRADAVLLPYRAATGSGVVALARHFRRPVVGSAVPGLAGEVIQRQDGWLFPPGDIDALASLLRHEVTRSRIAVMTPALEDAARRLSWASFADALLGLIEE